MTTRAVALSAVKAGITRLREKGGASEKTLFDLVNGYVNAARAPTARPGTAVELTLPPGTKGLVYFDGAFVVFSHQVVAGMPAGVSCAVLTNPNDASQAIKAIHFAKPFLGFLYVVAEFANGEVFHYWLQGADTWQSNKGYCDGTLVQPSVPNGLVYRAKRLGASNPTWKADVARAVGDVVEPTTPNCFKYTVISVIGDAKSGATEPTWPTDDGATVYEDTGLGTPPPPSAPPSTPPSVPPGTGDRYGNLPGRGNDSRSIK